MAASCLLRITLGVFLLGGAFVAYKRFRRMLRKIRRQKKRMSKPSAWSLEVTSQWEGTSVDPPYPIEKEKQETKQEPTPPIPPSPSPPDHSKSIEAHNPDMPPEVPQRESTDSQKIYTPNPKTRFPDPVERKTVPEQGMKKEFPEKKEYREKIKVGTVKEIICYPVTSCEGIRGSLVECTAYGLKMSGILDREFIVAQRDPTGRRPHEIQLFQSADLSYIRAGTDGNNLILNGRGYPEVRCPLKYQPDYKKKRVICPGQDMDAFDCGKDYVIGEWLSKFLKIPRLGLFRLDYTSETFKNVGYLIATKSTIEAVNEAFNLQPQLTTEYFRPNIVIEGSKPLDEANWAELYIGKNSQVSMKVQADDIKLVLAPYDKESDEWRWAVTLPANLKSPSVGIYATVFKEGVIRNGDPVYAVYKPSFDRSLTL